MYIWFSFCNWAQNSWSLWYFLNARDKRWRGQWQPTPVLLPGGSHGWRSLVGCSPWSREESDKTEWLHFHFSLSYIGEGNGNPLQCSCLENSRDGGAWWAAVYGVTQSRTQLKRLSSSRGWNGQETGGRFKREGIYVYLWLIHFEVWQKTNFCKAIILQLKKKSKG